MSLSRLRFATGHHESELLVDDVAPGLHVIHAELPLAPVQVAASHGLGLQQSAPLAADHLTPLLDPHDASETLLVDLQRPGQLRDTLAHDLAAWCRETAMAPLAHLESEIATLRQRLAPHGHSELREAELRSRREHLWRLIQTWRSPEPMPVSNEHASWRRQLRAVRAQVRKIRKQRLELRQQWQKLQAQRGARPANSSKTDHPALRKELAQVERRLRHLEKLQQLALRHTRALGADLTLPESARLDNPRGSLRSLDHRLHELQQTAEQYARRSTEECQCADLRNLLKNVIAEFQRDLQDLSTQFNDWQLERQRTRAYDYASAQRRLVQDFHHTIHSLRLHRQHLVYRLTQWNVAAPTALDDSDWQTRYKRLGRELQARRQQAVELRRLLAQPLPVRAPVATHSLDALHRELAEVDHGLHQEQQVRSWRTRLAQLEQEWATAHSRRTQDPRRTLFAHYLQRLSDQELTDLRALNSGEVTLVDRQGQSHRLGSLAPRHEKLALAAWALTQHHSQSSGSRRQSLLLAQPFHLFDASHLPQVFSTLSSAATYGQIVCLTTDGRALAAAQEHPVSLTRLEREHAPAPAREMAPLTSSYREVTLPAVMSFAPVASTPFREVSVEPAPRMTYAGESAALAEPAPPQRFSMVANASEFVDRHPVRNFVPTLHRGSTLPWEEPVTAEATHYVSLSNELAALGDVDADLLERFDAVGIHTLAQLLSEPAESVFARLNESIPLARLRSWQSRAQLMRDLPELSTLDARLLSACGLTQIGDLAQLDASELRQRVERFLHSEAGHPLRALLDAHWHDRIRSWQDWARAYEHRRGSRRSFRSSRGDRSPLNAARPQRNGLHPREERRARRATTRSPRQQIHREASLEQGLSIRTKWMDQLRGLGITTIAQLLDQSPTQLATQMRASRVNVDIVETWQRQAELVLRAPGLRASDARLLVALGIQDIATLAATDPGSLLGRIENLRQQPSSRMLFRNRRPVDLAKATQWVTYARRGLESHAA